VGERPLRALAGRLVLREPGALSAELVALDFGHPVAAPAHYV